MKEGLGKAEKELGIRFCFTPAPLKGKEKSLKLPKVSGLESGNT